MEAVSRTVGLPQEGLKLLACLTMLMDHIGAVLLPASILMRLVGRLSFPLYCFLLAQGVKHTKKPGRYLLRLGICLLLSEIPMTCCFTADLHGRLKV